MGEGHQRQREQPLQRLRGPERFIRELQPFKSGQKAWTLFPPRGNKSARPPKSEKKGPRLLEPERPKSLSLMGIRGCSGGQCLPVTACPGRVTEPGASPPTLRVFLLAMATFIGTVRSDKGLFVQREGPPLGR